MSEWRQITLRDVGTVQSGFAFKSRDWAEVGVPVVKIQNVRGGRVNLTDCSFVPQAVAASAADRYGLSRGDVLITMSGEIGSVGIVCSDTDILLNQRVGRVRLNETDPVLLRFIGYALQRPELKSLMVNIAYGVAQPNISPSLLESLPLQLPPRESQRIIGEVLGTIDDLIENNRRRVEVLEEMARAVYREWFVRFRYPGHENVPLVDSPLGPIPEGWEIKVVGDLAVIDKGLSYKGVHLAESGTPMANLKCLRPGGGFRRAGAKPYNGPFKPRHQVSIGDLVVANTDLTQAGAVIGSPAFIPRKGFEDGGIASHHLFIVRPLEHVGKHWLYETFRDDRFRGYTRGVASGTTVLGFRPVDLADFRLPVPPLELARRFEEIAAGFADLSDGLADLMEVLAFQRDLLLPKLVTGQIDVSHLDLGAPTEAATA